MRLTMVAAALIASASAHAGTRVVSNKTTSFAACLATIQEVSGQLGVAPINFVETSILRMVRLPTNDGSGKSILVTCSKPDQKMVIHESW